MPNNGLWPRVHLVIPSFARIFTRSESGKPCGTACKLQLEGFVRPFPKLYPGSVYQGLTITDEGEGTSPNGLLTIELHKPGDQVVTRQRESVAEPDHYERGHFLYESRRYREACGEFQECLKVNPSHAKAKSMLALARFATGNYQDARRLSDEAIGSAPDESFAFFAAAYIHFQQDDYKKARKLIDEALRLAPDNAWYLDVSSRLYLIQGKLKLALAEAEHGLQADPEHISCLNCRAMTLIRLKRGKEALESVDVALSHNPDSSLTHANKGWLLLDQNRTQEAMDHFREALRLQPNNSWAREGVIESLKHRHFLYGVVAGSSLALSKVSRTGPLFWIIWLLPPMRALYLLLVLISWLGNQLFNLALCLDPLTRRVLTSAERYSSYAFGSLIIASMVVAICGAAKLLSEGGLIVAYSAVLVMAFPLSRTFQFEGTGRRLMFLYDLVIGSCGLAAIALARGARDSDHLPEDAQALLGFMFCLAIASLFFRRKQSPVSIED